MYRGAFINPKPSLRVVLSAPFINRKTFRRQFPHIFFAAVRAIKLCYDESMLTGQLSSNNLSYILSRFFRAVYHLVRRAAWTVFGLVEFCIALRLALKFLGANAGTLVVRYIFSYTDLLLAPFRSIFPDYVWYGKSVELTSVAAMLGYIILAIIVLSFIKLFHRVGTPPHIPPPIQFR